MRCPMCNSTLLVKDYQTDGLICLNCGKWIPMREYNGRYMKNG